MIIARPITLIEPDLLLGREFEALKFKDAPDGHLLALVPAPPGGWTHDALEQVSLPISANGTWDAYLGPEWVGSSEI